MIYLASPYSNKLPEVRQQRFEATRAFVATKLKEHVEAIFSPIVYCHEMAALYNFPTDAAFWETFNYGFVVRSSRIWVLTLDGWEQSVGVNLEIQWAKDLNLPVEYRPWHE